MVVNVAQLFECCAIPRQRRIATGERTEKRLFSIVVPVQDLSPGSDAISRKGQDSHLGCYIRSHRCAMELDARKQHARPKVTTVNPLRFR